MKMKFIITFGTLLVVLMPNASAQHLYVRPTGSLNCPGQPCLSLDQYTEQPATYFITGTTFIFLAGNHFLHTSANLSNISEIAFRAEANSVHVNILCMSTLAIVCDNVSHLRIEGLRFIYHGDTNASAMALKITNSRQIWINGVAFQGSGYLVRGLHVTYSVLAVTNCQFARNSAGNGGAIYASTSNITLNGNTFIGNTATSPNDLIGISAGNGGAIYASTSNITLNGNTFIGNKAAGNGGAIFVQHTNIIINGSIKTDSVCNSSVVSCYTINATSTNNYSLFAESVMDLNETLFIACSAYFAKNEATAGGSIWAHSSYLTLQGSVIVFRNNSALKGGGAMQVINSIMITTAHHLFFSRNRAAGKDGGGGVCLLGTAFHSQMGSLYFLHNSAPYGGGISVDLPNTNFTLSCWTALFISNSAGFGGAMYLTNSVVTSIGGRIIKFINNSATTAGGGIFSENFYLRLTIAAKELDFTNNTAQKGGGLYLLFNALVEVVSANFVGNTAETCGGAAYFVWGYVHFRNLTAIANSNCALCLYECRLNFTGATTISRNIGTGNNGGGITSHNSHLIFADHTVFDSNIASFGGAISIPNNATLEFSGDTIFKHNRAEMDGGAIFSIGARIKFLDNNEISFMYNSARNGGAMYLNSFTFLTFSQKVTLLTSHNVAAKYGGGIYHEDAASSAQCYYENAGWMDLPYCFIRFTYGLPLNKRYHSTKIYSRNNSAIKGSFLYGGLLDRCLLFNLRSSLHYLTHFRFGYFFNKTELLNTNQDISSQPYRLKFCDDYSNVNIYSGQKFILSVKALDQFKTAVPTNITAVSPGGRLRFKQSSQFLADSCSRVSYNLYSTRDNEKLILYPNGPCGATGLAKAVVNVTFRPCPGGFNLSGELCVCEDKLSKYGAVCTIDKDVTISRGEAGPKFWVQGLYENETYQGLILYKTCPIDYCKIGHVLIVLDSPDSQCDLNRSGVLCGACSTNHSLMLGSSRCHVCPNTYLALLLPFAAAGIALVVFLSILRLTVATGMVNSVILYANVVQANKSLFLPFGSRNILTVFIAWMNLDLGFETCFYDGMTAYAQTWLQFAFPLYVWILISLIIFTSKYSVTMSKLIGHNPIAVLATLLLMSYTKILKIIIDVYSFVNLDYPHGEVNTVWLKDANVPYLQSWHLLLTVVTSLTLVFLFLPYTVFLLLGHKLYRFSGRKQFHWLKRFKPLLESYYAPYHIHTRYWPGFLLLVRCGLYIVFSLGVTSTSLLGISITFTALVSVGWVITKVYKSYVNNTVEVSVYLNLIALSAATSNSIISATLSYSLVGMVFATMLGIVVYQFHLLYIAKSAFWLKIKNMLKKSPVNPPEIDLAHATPTPLAVSTTVVNLREPLLEN